MGKIPELSISPDKVFFIISKARQSDFETDEPDLISGLTDDDAVQGQEPARGPTARNCSASFATSM